MRTFKNNVQSKVWINKYNNNDMKCQFFQSVRPPMDLSNKECATRVVPDL